MSNQRQGIFTLLILLAVRLVGMYIIPLNETTEARYGEIARKMLETGNWVTLLHDYNVPFLAKPPLSTWLAAGSMGLLGVNELAVRLPDLLLSIGVIALTALLAATRHNRSTVISTSVILASSLGFFTAAGTVMTDPVLLFCTTLIIVAFWLALKKENRRWGYLFFMGCGLGLLAKGPIALVLTGIPIFLWVLRRRQWRQLWQQLPWVTGSLLTLAIALPWYLLAEQQTPEFLQYFLVGENIDRFLDPHWQGDRYGFAHAYPYGMIWVFMMIGFFPWCLVLLGQWQQLKKISRDTDGWRLYIILWSLTTPIFFTFAANIIWPYCLIALPGLALLLMETKISGKYVPLLGTTTALIGTLAIAAFVFYPEKMNQNQKDVITAWRHLHPAADSKLMFWSNRMEFSAAFYSLGRARSTEDPALAEDLTKNSTQDYIVAYSFDLKALPPDILKKFHEIGYYNNKRGNRILLQEKP